MKKLIAMIAASLCLIACSEDDDIQTETATLYEITTFTENGITATIYSEQETLIVGYNKLQIKLESETAIENESVTISPIMDMMTMSHACPMEYIDNTVTDGKIEEAIVFVMPSGEMGRWTVTFEVAGETITVPVTVVQPEYSKLVSFTNDSIGETHFITLIEPSAPEVGQNKIEVAIFKRASMMEWPAVNGLTLQMEPWMPSMDHGSPNNVAPVFTSNGHYKGTVNFTMTGDWQIKLTVLDNDMALGDPYFDLYFQ